MLEASLQPRAEVALAVIRVSPSDLSAPAPRAPSGARATSSSPRGAGRLQRGDAALLEVHAAAGEVVDDLRERRLVADDEDLGVVVVRVQQRERVDAA